MLAIPVVGSVVRVTTRHRESLLYAKNAYRERTYTGRVVKSDKWMSPAEFSVHTGTPDYPVSSFHIKNVVRIEFVSGSAQAAVPAGVRNYRVYNKTTKKEYFVTYSQQNYTCTCTGFSYRKTCKHIGAVSKKVKSALA